MKRAVLTGSMIVLLSCWLPGERLRGQEPELTAEQEKLLKEANALQLEGRKLYEQAKLPEMCHSDYPSSASLYPGRRAA